MTELLAGIDIGLFIALILIVSIKRLKKIEWRNMWRRFYYYHLGGKEEMEERDRQIAKQGPPHLGVGSSDGKFEAHWKENAHGLSLGERAKAKTPIQQVKEMVAKQIEKQKHDGTANKRRTKSRS